MQCETQCAAVFSVSSLPATASHTALYGGGTYLTMLIAPRGCTKGTFILRRLRIGRK